MKIKPEYKEYIEKVANSNKLDLSFTGVSFIELREIIKFINQIYFNVETLKISYLASSELPPTIFELTSLKSLTIMSGTILKLNEEIENLTALNYLNLDRNRLESLPNSLAKLDKLETINLNSNSFTVLPSCLFHISNLKILQINSNKFQEIAIDNNQLKNLESISLEKNSLKQAVIESRNLKSLNLSSNELENIKLKTNKLEELYLNNNPLIQIDLDLSGLKNLKILQIINRTSTSSLPAIPNSIFQLKNLEELDLSGNQIIDIPDSISKLNNLKKLVISANSITYLSDNITKLVNLEVLDLSNRLMLSRKKKLESLPENIGALTSLRTLILNLHSISILPSSIGNLKNLKNLQLLRNNIHNLPYTIENLISLEVLNLQGNPLEDLPNSLANLPMLKTLSYNVETLIETSLFKRFGLAQISRLIQNQEKENIRIGLFKLPDILRTAFQRYFAAFDDFWRDVTGKDINFKVNKHIEGIEIEVELSSQVTKEEVENLLNQYFSLLSMKTDEISQNLKNIVNENRHLNEMVITAEVRVEQLRTDLKLAEFKNVEIAKFAQQSINDKQQIIIELNSTVIGLKSENRILKEIKGEHLNLLSLAVPSSKVDVRQNQVNHTSVNTNSELV